MISRINPTLPELVPSLLRNDRGPVFPPAQPLRTALVRHNVETTYVVPGDWPPMDDTRWFLDRAPTGNSDVQYLVDGPDTLDAMRQAMETAESSSHFIVLLGWSLDVTTFMAGDGKGHEPTFLQLVEQRARLGVAVRVLLWDNTEYHVNAEAKARLGELRTKHDLDVDCCLDDNTKGYVSKWVATKAGKPQVHSYGCHHQKILLVFGKDGLVGFCGGIDVDPNRRPGSGGGLHDVHVRVRGAAAEELWKIAERRWAESSDDGKPPSPPSISGLAPKTFPKPGSIHYLTRVVETVGNPNIAKARSSTLWAAVREAIGRATSFIYMEDQYFWSLDLVDALLEASSRLRHITLLLPPALRSEHPHKRQQALAALVSKGGPHVSDKIAIFESRAPLGHDWVHAKLFVVDDEFAIVGSANANNRGYFLDSEAAVCVAERSARDAGGTRAGEWFAIEGNFARRLRMQLWAEHLNLPLEELFDGVGAHVHWRRIMFDLDGKDPMTANARVAAYRAVNLRKHEWHELIKDMRDKEVDPGKQDEWHNRSLHLPEISPRNIDADSRPWDAARDEKPWWSAPYEEFAPPAPAKDRVIDPRD